MEGDTSMKCWRNMCMYMWKSFKIQFSCCYLWFSYVFRYYFWITVFCYRLYIACPLPHPSLFMSSSVIMLNIYKAFWDFERNQNISRQVFRLWNKSCIPGPTCCRQRWQSKGQTWRVRRVLQWWGHRSHPGPLWWCGRIAGLLAVIQQNTIIVRWTMCPWIFLFDSRWCFYQ